MSKAMMFARLAKVNEATRQVTGIIASESPDAAKEIFDYDTSKPNFEKWSTDLAKATEGKNLGNVRAMHGNVAAGALSAITFDDVIKSIEVTADIVDDNEWNKVMKGIYTGFSIGGKYERKWDDEVLKGHKRYTAKPHEVSLVDLPCNPGATFVMVKADGLEEQVEFHVPDEGELMQKMQDATDPAEKREMFKRLATLNGLTFLEPEEAVEKGAYSIGRLAELAESCENFMSYSCFEIGGEQRVFTDDVKKAAGILYDALLKMIDEDVAAAKLRLKGVKKDAAESDDLQKSILVNAHDALNKVFTSLGIEEGAELSVGLDALNKVISETDDLKKQLTESLEKISKLEENPAPAKGAVKAVPVDKSNDGTVAKADGTEGDKPTSTDPLVLMKAVHKGGGRSVSMNDVLAKPA